VAAVIDGLGLGRPVLVAWSYGGVVAGEFLRHRGGAARVSGLLSAAAAVRAGRSSRACFGPAMIDHARGLASDDDAAYRAASAAFVAGCTATPRPDFAAAALEAMALVPAKVRRALLARDVDYVADYAGAGVPLAAIHGDDDRVVWPALSEEVVARAPSTALTRVPGAGHATFVEAPEAFERALRGLLRP
jgi:non-heme chloroperoxidase